MEAMRQELPYHIKGTKNLQQVEMISSEKKKKNRDKKWKNSQGSVHIKPRI